jgi:Xaa-Pro aminopeptidase
MISKVTFRRRIALTALLVGLIVIASGFSCQQAKSAAVMVNRYAESLSTFQDVAIKEHDLKRISDQNYANLLKSEKEASHAGRDLDKAIELANNGADFSQYVDAAQVSFNDMAGLIGGAKDPEAVAALQAAAAISAGLLKDAIILIKQVKPAPLAPRQSLQ